MPELNVDITSVEITAIDVANRRCRSGMNRCVRAVPTENRVSSHHPEAGSRHRWARAIDGIAARHVPGCGTARSARWRPRGKAAPGRITLPAP
jgi:hypothetical protein